MGEQKDQEEQIIENDEYEVSVSNEMTDETAEKSSEKLEEEKESAGKSVEYTPLPDKTKKHHKAKYLINKAKKRADEATKRIEECRELLETGLRSYEEAKSALHEGGLDECIFLLNQLGHRVKEDKEKTSKQIFETKEAFKPFTLKDISRGRGIGFLYALFGGIATAMGMVYLATKKLEMTLDLAKVPSENEMESILAWFSTIIGVQEDVAIGAGVLGSIVLSVMIVIYIAYLRVKAKYNLHYAVKRFVEAELYAEQNPDCKEEMEKVDEHIKDAIGTLKAYEVVLNEQKGKLQRILYFEGEKDKGASYHDKSLAEIEDTKGLIDTISVLIGMPVVEDQKVSDDSILSLQKAKDKIYTIIKRF